jgi:hypothetical protein
MAAEWGLDAPLGWKDAGTGLDDDASASLPLPSGTKVVAYAREAFAAAEDVLGGVRNEDLHVATSNLFDDEPCSVLDHLLWHLVHGARHLGMIEALKGVLGVRGTATI